jgi:hypothetical protein
MGGPFQRMFFVLEIFGDELDPEKISKALGVRPDQSYKKGDERPRGSQYYKTGAWILKSGEVQIAEDRSGEERFEDWTSKLPGDADTWRSLKEHYSVTVRLVGYTDQWNADFTISPKTLSHLSDLGLPLTIDPYLSLDEPDA